MSKENPKKHLLPDEFELYLHTLMHGFLRMLAEHTEEVLEGVTYTRTVLEKEVQSRRQAASQDPKDLEALAALEGALGPITNEDFNSSAYRAVRLLQDYYGITEVGGYFWQHRGPIRELFEQEYGAELVDEVVKDTIKSYLGILAKERQAPARDN